VSRGKRQGKREEVKGKRGRLLLQSQRNNKVKERREIKIGSLLIFTF